MNSIKKHWKLILYILIGALFLYIAYNVPYCHDEWEWGTAHRWELFKNGFKDYNGRYLGNILALIITKSVWAKTAVMTIGALCVIKAVDVGIKRTAERCGTAHAEPFLLTFAAFLLIALPQTLFRQSYGWSAAFVNFVPPVFLFLIFFNWSEQVYVADEINYSKMQLLAAAPIAIATQLFSEHITVFTVLYALWITLFAAVKFKKLHAVHITYLVSSVIGAAIMFSNGAYGNAADNTDGYKHISFTVSGIIEQFCNNISDHLFLNNRLLNIALAGILIALIAIKKKKGIAHALLTVVLAGYSVFGLWYKTHPDWVFVNNADLNNKIKTAFALLFALCVFISLCIITDKREKYPIMILYLSSFAVAAPLLVANPIGARCFYISYVFEVLTVIKLLTVLLSELSVKELFYPQIFVIAATVIVALSLVRTFSYVGRADRVRADIIEREVSSGATEITLPKLPYYQYYWITVPPTDSWEEWFKEFYGIPKNVDVKFE